MSSANSPTAEYTWDFFLAHAGPDKHIAEILYDLLVPHSRVFLDSRCLRLGDNWDQRLAQAQQSSRITLVLVSLGTDNAYYQREEIATAIAMARQDKDKHRIIPIYLDHWFEDTNNRPYGLRLIHSLSLSSTMGLAEIAHHLLELLAQLDQATTLNPMVKSTQTLQISLKARPLDGYAIRKLNNPNQGWFEKGCKFRISMQNIGHEQLIIDGISLRIEDYQSLQDISAQSLRVDTMKFGDVVVAHQLFIELYRTHLDGWWVVTIANTRQQKRIVPNSTNLLETESGESIVFVLKPGSLELIIGAILPKESGLYKAAFCFDYSSPSNESGQIKTAPLPILGYNVER